MPRRLGRRRFLQSAGAAAAALTILPAGSARTYAANAKLDIAVIGSGIGLHNTRELAKSGENIAAVCEVDRRFLESRWRDFPDAKRYVDFRKMLDLTILRFTDRANFAGAWIRPRAQLPMGFGDATRARFAAEANRGESVSRQDLIDDEELLARYQAWWYGKRAEFLVAMRDHLRQSGAGPDATILYTACSGEPGVSFPTWDKTIVTDDPKEPELKVRLVARSK